MTSGSLVAFQVKLSSLQPQLADASCTIGIVRKKFHPVIVILRLRWQDRDQMSDNVSTTQPEVHYSLVFFKKVLVQVVKTLGENDQQDEQNEVLSNEPI